MNLLFGQDKLVSEFVSEKTGRPFTPPFVTIGWVDKKNNLVGGAVFNNYELSNIELSVATDRPVTRGILRALAYYVFVQLACYRLTIRSRVSNKAACKGARKLGFKYECTLEKWFGPEDGVQFKLTPENCKWI